MRISIHEIIIAFMSLWSQWMQFGTI